MAHTPVHPVIINYFFQWLSKKPKCSVDHNRRPGYGDLASAKGNPFHQNPEPGFSELLHAQSIRLLITRKLLPPAPHPRWLNDR